MVRTNSRRPPQHPLFLEGQEHITEAYSENLATRERERVRPGSAAHVVPIPPFCTAPLGFRQQNLKCLLLVRDVSAGTTFLGNLSVRRRL